MTDVRDSILRSLYEERSALMKLQRADRLDHLQADYLKDINAEIDRLELEELESREASSDKWRRLELLADQALAVASMVRKTK